MTRYRIYVGPTIVAQIAERLRTAGINVTVEGTEHIHVETRLSEREVLTALGPTWNWRDIQQIGSTPQHTK